MKNLFRFLGLAALVAAGASAQASQITLPTANNLTAGTYGDFTVYSLDLLAQCYPVDPACGGFSGDKGGGVPQTKVSSQQLAGDMIVYRNENGTPTSNYVQGPLAGGTIKTAGVDNPFDAPTGGPLSFDMSSTNEPGTETAGTTSVTPDFVAGDPANATDKIGTWEAKLSTVANYVGAGKGVIFLFDNNQQGNDVSQQQFFWATLTIVDSAGNAVAGLKDKFGNAVKNCYELRGNGVDGSNRPPNAAFAANDCVLGQDYSYGADLKSFADDTPGEFVGSGGGFCVVKDTLGNSHGAYGDSYLLTGFVHPTNQADCGTDYFVNNNLGQDTAEFAVTLKALDDNLAAWAAAGYSMSINFKMRNLNDGGEELWIASGRENLVLPEPATLSLIGLALLGIGASARRRRA